MEKFNTKIEIREDVASTANMISLSILSLYYALLSYFIVMVIEHAGYAIMMFMYKIPFVYSLFFVETLTHSTQFWNEGNAIAVYGSVHLLILGIGILLLVKLFDQRSMYWKNRLFLTWLVFIISNYIFSGFFSGSFIFDGFGCALQYLIPSVVLRLAIVILLLIIYIWLGRFWSILFFSTAYSSRFIRSSGLQRRFVMHVFVWPYLAMAIIASMFYLPNIDFYNSIQLAYPIFYTLPLLVYLPEPGRIHLTSKGRLKVNREQWIVLVLSLVLVMKMLSFIDLNVS
jgi:hypothetical protein